MRGTPIQEIRHNSKHSLGQCPTVLGLYNDTTTKAQALLRCFRPFRLAVVPGSNVNHAETWDRCAYFRVSGHGGGGPGRFGFRIRGNDCGRAKEGDALGISISLCILMCRKSRKIRVGVRVRVRRERHRSALILGSLLSLDSETELQRRRGAELDTARA
jgi:hypothetical protein